MMIISQKQLQKIPKCDQANQQSEELKVVE